MNLLLLYPFFGHKGGANFIFYSHRFFKSLNNPPPPIFNINLPPHLKLPQLNQGPPLPPGIIPPPPSVLSAAPVVAAPAPAPQQAVAAAGSAAAAAVHPPNANLRTEFVVTKKKHQCQSCEKSYSTSTGLKQHVDSAHLGKRPFECDICGKAFARNTLLKIHKDSVHHGIRHPCQECGRQFSGRNRLLEHIRKTHS